MDVNNRDVFPADDLIALFSACGPVVVNPIVDSAFIEHETKAVAGKLSYHQQGRFSLLLVLASIVFTVVSALVVPAQVQSQPVYWVMALLAVLAGLVGVAVQIRLLLSGKKKAWLVNRFAAERLRSIKFQAYQFAGSVESLADLQKHADAFYTAEVARLRAELNSGESALSNFSPNRSVVKRAVSGPAVPGEQFEVMKSAYRELRLDYQLRFARGELRTLQAAQRVGYALADLLYLSGAALTILTLFFKLSGLPAPQKEVFMHWIDLLAILSFIFGFTLTMFENASLTESSRGRYEDYIRALEERDRELADDEAPFHDVVQQIERVVLGELSQFSLSALQISYRI